MTKKAKKFLSRALQWGRIRPFTMHSVWSRQCTLNCISYYSTELTLFTLFFWLIPWWSSPAPCRPLGQLLVTILIFISPYPIYICSKRLKIHQPGPGMREVTAVCNTQCPKPIVYIKLYLWLFYRIVSLTLFWGLPWWSSPAPCRPLGRCRRAGGWSGRGLPPRRTSGPAGSPPGSAAAPRPRFPDK